MSRKKKIIPIQSEGKEIWVEVSHLGGEEDISDTIPQFEDVEESISRTAKLVQKSLSHVDAKKLTVEFGLELMLKSGKITSFLVEGEGKGSLKVTLEWEK